MILRLLNWFAARRRSFTIPNLDGSPYLWRVLLRGRLTGENKRPPLSLYLHQFHSSDGDRDLHNHPWDWSLSIILWGGYVEEKRQRDGTIITRRLWPFMINWLGPKDFHRIRELKGRETWTLFIAGRKTRDWGFMVNGIFIPHQAYMQAKGFKPIEENIDPPPQWLEPCFDCKRPIVPPAHKYIRISQYHFVAVCQACGANLNIAKARVVLAEYINNGKIGSVLLEGRIKDAC